MMRRDGQDIISKSGMNEPNEYFCKACKQLRLSLIADKSRCGNCGSEDIITGAIGSLDKQALLKQYKT